ncbi:MAG: hypothetical protein ACRCV7_05160 [Culicoidibacterales bacterium]
MMNEHFTDEGQREYKRENEEITIQNSEPTHVFTPQYITPDQQSETEVQTVQRIGRIIQVPEYSEEQLHMQEAIRQDQYHLLKKREKMKIQLIGAMIMMSIFTLFNITLLFELTNLGFIHGADIRRFSGFEMLILCVIYTLFIILGIIAFIYLSASLMKINKIRVMSISTFEKSLKVGLFLSALVTSGFFFLAAFWLMTSLSGYWLFFLFQTVLSLIAYGIITMLLNHAEYVESVVVQNKIKHDDKPNAEIAYYQPISYREEIHYNN